jgi:hypothetical protein
VLYLIQLICLPRLVANRTRYKKSGISKIVIMLYNMIKIRVGFTTYVIEILDCRPLNSRYIGYRVLVIDKNPLIFIRRKLAQPVQILSISGDYDIDCP